MALLSCPWRQQDVLMDDSWLKLQGKRKINKFWGKKSLFKAKQSLQTNRNKKQMLIFDVNIRNNLHIERTLKLVFEVLDHEKKSDEKDWCPVESLQIQYLRTLFLLFHQQKWWISIWQLFFSIRKYKSGKVTTWSKNSFSAKNT